MIQKTANRLMLGVRFSQLPLFWKFIITINIVLDIPILLYILTGYYWNCKFNQYPDWILFTLLWISTSILIWSSYQLNNNVFGGVGRVIHFLCISMFSVISFVGICFLSLAILFSIGNEQGSWIDSSAVSPNTLRIAEVCGVNCGDSCIEQYELRVGNRFLPFADLYIDNLKYGSPDYFVPNISWVDKDTISVTESVNKTRLVHVGSLNFNWLYLLIFCFYGYIKYGYMLNGLQPTKDEEIVDLPIEGISIE